MQDETRLTEALRMATGSVNNIWASYHVPGRCGDGMTIYSSISIRGYRADGSNPLILGYWFYRTDGKPVPGLDKEYTDGHGNAAVGKRVDVSGESADYDRFPVFVPYKAFQSQASDSFEGYVSAALLEGARVIAKSPQALRFALAPSPPMDYFELFNIPRNANRETIKKILDQEYEKYRARVVSPILEIRHEAELMLVEISKARQVLLGG